MYFFAVRLLSPAGYLQTKNNAWNERDANLDARDMHRRVYLCEVFATNAVADAVVITGGDVTMTTASDDHDHS